jgi:diketogulonate reductase-like aldo/keto reductase
VSKVLPSHATRRGTVAACKHSLQRLRTNRLDLYLLHWPGTVPLERTLAGFSDLLEAGKIRYWGVSNFDRSAMLELETLPGGKTVTTDQVLYNLTRRGVEYDLPWCHKQNIPVIAYSPIEQGRLLHHPVLKRIAQHHQATPAQVALAWVLRQDGIIAIPQAGDPSHVLENHGALDVKPTTRDLEALDQAFPPPRGPEPLDML